LRLFWLGMNLVCSFSGLVRIPSSIGVPFSVARISPRQSEMLE
jgi:hypothetical protein